MDFLAVLPIEPLHSKISGVQFGWQESGFRHLYAAFLGTEGIIVFLFSDIAPIKRRGELHNPFPSLHLIVYLGPGSPRGAAQAKDLV